MSGSKNDASIIAVLGASGSGKSAFVKQHLAKTSPRRLLIWDPLHEYDDHGQTLRSAADLLAALKRAGAGGRFSLVFQPSHDEKRRAQEFDFFCAAAYTAGNLVMVVEELKFVTRPGYAPVRWARCTLTGRHRGLKIIGITQRPASIDKDFLGNATLIHVCKLVYPEDRRAVARAACIEEAEIERLLPLMFVEKNMQTGKIKRGKLSFPNVT